MSTTVSEVTGIERNAASRFIDFSCSTDWEKSILRVENFVRSIILRGRDNDSETFSFLGTKLKISFHCTTLKADAHRYFPSLFDIENRYILVSRPGSNWLDCTTSQRHTLFSILVTSLQSCAGSVHDSSSRVPPIFFTMANDESIQSSRTLDIMGYQICKLPNSSLIVNFSSINQNYNLLEDGREEFRHVDSLAQLFLKHLITYHLDKDISEFKSNMIVQVREQSSIKVQNFFVKNVPHESEIFPLMTALLKHIKSSPPYSMSGIDATVVKSINLSAVLVYPRMKLTSIVDNENYSTLVPSKQSPYCWSILSSFSTPVSESKSSTSVTLSCCVRRLLASFIYNKSLSYVRVTKATSNKGKVPRNQAERASNTDKNKNDIDLMVSEKSDKVASILSQKTIQLVRSMRTHEEDKESEDQYINNLLALLFQRGNCDANKNQRKSPLSTIFPTDTDLLIRKCANSTIEFLSLYALCAGTLQSFSFFGILWSRFLLALRSRWDEGTPLPGLNGPKCNNHERSDIGTNSPKGPLRKQLMWHDIMEKREILSNYCRRRIIDLSLSILAQKFQAFQFCIVVKNDGVLCNPFGDSLSLQRRLPLTADAVAQRKFILQKLNPSNTGRETTVIISPPCGSQSFDSVSSNEFLDSKEGEEEGNGKEEVGEGKKGGRGDKEEEISGKGNRQGEKEGEDAGSKRKGVETIEANGGGDGEVMERGKGKVGEVISLLSPMEFSSDKTHDGTLESCTISGKFIQIKKSNKILKEGEICGTNDNKEEDVMIITTTDASMLSSDNHNISVSPSQLQYWRVEQDVVISDMKAWKAENLSYDNIGGGDSSNSNEDVDSESKFEEFVEWYTGRDIEESDDGNYDDLEYDSEYVDVTAADGSINSKGDASWEGIPPSLLVAWSHLWRLCSPACPAIQQKPLYNPETEVEKILGFMGSLDPVRLASELLLATLASGPSLLSSMIEEHLSIVIALIRTISPSVSTESIRGILGQEEELELLYMTINKIQKEMKDDLILSESEDIRNISATATTINQSSLLLVDRAAIIMERIEEYSCRIKAFCGAISHAIGLPSVINNSTSTSTAAKVMVTENVEDLTSFSLILPSIIHSLCTTPCLNSSSSPGDVHSSVFSPTNTKEVECRYFVLYRDDLY